MIGKKGCGQTLVIEQWVQNRCDVMGFRFAGREKKSGLAHAVCRFNIIGGVRSAQPHRL